MPPALARIAARTAGSSSSARARSDGRCLAGGTIASAVGVSRFPTRAAVRGSAARSCAGCCGRTTGVHPGPSLLRAVFAQFNSDPHAIVRWMSSARPRDFATSGAARRPACTPGRSGRLRVDAAGRGTCRCAGRAARRARRAAVGVGWRAVVEPGAVAQPRDEAATGSCGGRCTRRCAAARTSAGPAGEACKLIREVLCAMAEAAQESPT